MRWLVPFYKVWSVPAAGPAEAQDSAPDTGESGKMPVYKPTQWGTYDLQGWGEEWCCASPHDSLTTHFWVLAGFSGFSLYGMTRSTAESGFWRRVPNLILISLALKEET